MRNTSKHLSPSSRLLHASLALAAVLAFASPAGAVTTNWIAFNDHVPGPLTAPNATVYNMRGITANPPQPVFGELTNFNTGLGVGAYMGSSATGTPDFFGSIAYPIAGSPAYELFNGKVDLGNANSAIGIRSSANSTVTLTFTNLDPGKLYDFRGTVVRGNNYVRRWTLASIRGALAYQDAHTTGVFTKDNFPTGTMTNGQAAYNSGENRTNGAVVGWVDIRPAADGTFFVKCEQYVDSPLPNGSTPDLGTYGYAFAGIMLAETGEPSPLGITVQPAALISVEQFRPFTISLTTTGSSPNFQWYKGNAGDVSMPIAGATRRIYSVLQAGFSDTGNYFCIATNVLNAVTSTVAQVTVYPDTNAPTVLRAVGTSPTTFSVFFNESVDPATATDVFSNDIEPDVALTSPITVNATNPRRVDFTVTPAMTLGRVYNYHAFVGESSVLDLAGNAVDRAHASATFIAQYYDGNLETLRDLPTTGMLALGSLTNRGFDLRIIKVATNKITTGNFNNLTLMEQLLAGTAIDAGTGQPHVNIAPVACTTEASTINYNKDAPAVVGTAHLGVTRQYPGIVPLLPGNVVENLLLEAVAYVELQPGIHRFGVNSDDGFRLTLATSAFDSAFTFGEFNGGRGAADTLMDFNVTQAGLYPIRLIYEEGNGGASVELWSVDLLTSLNAYIGINDPAGVLAYRHVAPTLTITTSGANDVICWPAGNAAYCLQSTSSLTPAIVWTDVLNAVVRNVGGNCVTVPNSGGAQYYRLILK